MVPFLQTYTISSLIYFLAQLIYGLFLKPYRISDEVTVYLLILALAVSSVVMAMKRTFQL